MSAKHQQNSFIKLATITLVFLYLQLLLWFTFTCPAIDIEVRWVRKSFFSSVKQIVCIIRTHHHKAMVFESTFFSAIALLGYVYGCAGAGGVGLCIYGTTLSNFEQSMMGVWYKYTWMCIVPWIIVFAQNWFLSVGEFLMLCSSTIVYGASNVFPSMAILMLFLALQALLASEVIYMALQGCRAMKNINDENMQWEQTKRFLDGDALNTAFGVMR